jgi:hypothetical protein
MFGTVQSFQTDSDVSDIARIQSLTSHWEISALCPRRRHAVNVAKTPHKVRRAVWLPWMMRSHKKKDLHCSTADGFWLLLDGTVHFMSSDRSSSSCCKLSKNTLQACCICSITACNSFWWTTNRGCRLGCIRSLLILLKVLQNCERG